MKKGDLQTTIRTAFEDVAYPGDDNIGIFGGRDDAERVTEWYRGVDWRSLTPDSIWPLGLYWMTPEAFHYYIPAYLLSSIDENAGDEYEFTIGNLTPPFADSDYTQTNKDRFQKIVGLMTLPQKKAIRDVLLFNLEDAIELQKKDEHPGLYDNQVEQLRFSLGYWTKVTNEEG